jgi:hypothetical protein
MRIALAVLPVLLLTAMLTFSACGEEDGGTYCCTYESRHTGCGGVGWSDWESESYEFNIDDYVEGWTPELVCDKFTGSDTECSATCCINTEYRSNTLADGTCP